MKILSIFIAAMLIACVRSDKEIFMKIMKDCTASVGASEADVAKLIMHNPPETHEQKCLLACVLAGANLV